MASSPPRCIRFDFQPWSDDFDYPDSDLTANDGWIISEIGPPSSIVVSNENTLTGTGTGAAARPGTFAGLPITDPWYIAVKLIFGTIGAIAAQTAIWWGDITLTVAELTMDTTTLVGGGNNCTVTITDGAGTATTMDIAIDGTIEHEFALRHEGADLIASLDGVDILTAAAAVLNPGTIDSFALYINADILGHIPRMTEVEANQWPEI